MVAGGHCIHSILGFVSNADVPISPTDAEPVVLQSSTTYARLKSVHSRANRLYIRKENMWLWSLCLLHGILANAEKSLGGDIIHTTKTEYFKTL